MHHTLCPGVHPLHTVQESPISLQVQKTISLQVECFLSQWVQDAVVAICEHVFLGIRVPA
jgi:hypothetical protein